MNIDRSNFHICALKYLWGGSREGGRWHPRNLDFKASIGNISLYMEVLLENEEGVRDVPLLLSPGRATIRFTNTRGIKV